MGRRIYDEEGNFVWKYTFGRQDSNMCLYAEEYGIGEYVETERSEGTSGEDAYEWTEYAWVVDPKTAVKELKALLKTLLNGHTEKELSEIGMKAVWSFVEMQSKDWKEHYASDLEALKKAKSHKDFEYYGSSGSGYTFEVYDIYCDAIEKHIECSHDFLAMTKEFIKHIEKHNSTTFIDEF